MARILAVGMGLWMLFCGARLPLAGGQDRHATVRQSFDREIAPLLAARCLDCHRGPEPKGGLDLSRQATAAAGGESGTAIVPGDPDQSLLWQYIARGEMPPKKSLPAAERERLRQWIADGAPWGSDPIDPFRYTSEHRAGYDWWAWQPLSAVPPPVGTPPGARSAIDHFVRARLESQGLTPSPEAEPRALVRRLYFDLIGLPPPPEVVAAFVAAPSDAAYDRLVDELLASPHYGERWARHWLDVCRYGESDGFERNFARDHSWPFRDWVVAALNANLAYDTFVRWQIAGDVLEPEKPEAIAATGFLVAGAHNTVVAANELAQKTARHDELEDQLATLGQAFLGLTVQCARCHDHKFDPITQRDYYRLVAAVDGVDHGQRPGLGPQGQAARSAQVAALQQEAVQLRRQIAELERAAVTRLLAARAARGDAERRPLAVMPLARWSFEGHARDELGGLHGELQGGARIEGGRLWLDGQDAFVVTAPLPQPLAEKTLEAWVVLEQLEQRGGGVMSVETLDGMTFDAIVFGERQPRRWMAGSNGFVRTRDIAEVDEVPGVASSVHLAIVYRSDGQIAIYRDGQPYGSPYNNDGAKLAQYPAAGAHVLFGKRHTGGGSPWFAGAIEEARLYDRALEARDIQVSYLAGPRADVVTAAELDAALTPDELGRRAGWLQSLRNADLRQKELATVSQVYAVISRQPPPTHLLLRGDVQQPQDAVAAGGVRALGEAADFGISLDAPDADRRRHLAAWITEAQHALLARVLVNRVWQHHFGIGLVDTPSDFGFNGGRPSHPELLEWLAHDFYRSGFDLKALHRRMVTSSTYRQASAPRPAALEVDADNRLLWRKSPMRLEAEVVRDAMLAVAGQLKSTLGGPPFHDVRTYYNSGTTYFEPLSDADPATWRRTLYRFTPRGERSPLLDTLDCPDPSVTAPRRQVTTTPLQALAILNDAFVLQMADAWSQRTAAGSGDHVTQQVRVCFRDALGRDPWPEEQLLAEALVTRHGLAALCRALFNTHEFVVVD